MRQYQDKDSAIKTVKNWIEKGSTRPKWTNITTEDGEVKALWSQWESLENRKGILYRKFQTETKEEPSVIYQYVAPKRLRKEIMRHLHDHRTGGHLGITKTLYNVRQRFYWPGSKKDIVRWCHHCKECGARKPKHGKKAPLQQEVAGMPMERIALDIMGPLPRSNSGNNYILVIGDYFTKWTQAHALPDHTAQTVAKIVVEEWICKMGVPHVIHSDQGPDFESNLFQEMCRLLEIDKTRTCPYLPQSDGMIERFNRTVTQMLATFVKGNRRDWDEHLPYLMLAYRSTLHESTRCSPNMMVFGRDLALPIDVIAGTPPVVDIPTCPVVYVEWLRGALEKSFKHAREALRQTATRQKRLYDHKAAEHGYSVGQWVFRWYPPAAHTKFGSGLTGPYLVLGKISDLVYQIQASRRSKPKVVHLDHLKPYFTNDDEVLVNWLEEPTGAEEPEGLLESPEDGASDLLTDTEVEGEPDIPEDIGYGDENKEDSESQVEQGSSKKASDAGEGSGLGASEPLMRTRSKRTIRRPRRYLQTIVSH